MLGNYLFRMCAYILVLYVGVRYMVDNVVGTHSFRWQVSINSVYGLKVRCHRGLDTFYEQLF